MATQEDPPYPDAPIPPVYKDYIDDLYDWMLENRSVAGPGILIGDAGGGGKQISAIGAAGTGQFPCPLEVEDASTDSDGLQVSVSWGLIQGRQPEGFSAGGDPEFKSPVSGTGYVYASCTFDLTTLQPTAAEIFISDNPFLPNTTTTTYRLLGSFTPDTDGTKLIVTSSCGDVDFSVCDLIPS